MTAATKIGSRPIDGTTYNMTPVICSPKSTTSYIVKLNECLYVLHCSREKNDKFANQFSTARLSRISRVWIRLIGVELLNIDTRFMITCVLPACSVKLPYC